MKNIRSLVALLLVGLTGVIGQTGSLVDRAILLEETGKFREAAAVLREGLTGGDSSQHQTLEFELDRLRRIRLDYSLTRDGLLTQLKKTVKDFTVDEFEQWMRDGWFDARMIDDTLRFIGVSRSNLFWRHPELEQRRQPPKDESLVEGRTWEAALAIIKASDSSGIATVLPKRFAVTMTVTVDADAVPAGKTVRAWLPVPRSYPHQKDLRILSSSSPVKELGADTASIRSAYMEEVAAAGHPTVFTLQYAYTAYGVHFRLDENAVERASTSDPNLRQFTAEGPHVLFTDRIRKLSKKIVGPETNPLKIARAIYRWMSDNLLYSYALEYSTIRNISDYCLTKGYGDCGQHALLFITLCRYNGIPARWQSGWYTFPGAKTIHDWAEIFLPPYGWIPVDPDMGVFALRYFTSLSLENRKTLRDFYFGGLEQYRIAANSDYCQELSPPKKFIRSDTVDFQRGEVEYDGGNIYFDQTSYSLKIKEEPLPSTGTKTGQ
jgi:transglutaminase-like putative cysteine protease